MPDQAKETLTSAIEGGQLDPESDEGPTPDAEGSGDSDAGGPTPDSSPTDADGSSPESEAEEQESAEDVTEEEVEEPEADDTVTDQDQDSDEDSGEEGIEEDEYFFDGEYSEYKTEKEARQGIEKKDELIYKYRDQLQEERKEKQEAKAQVQSLRETMPEDQQKEMVVRQYMRDELGEENEELLSMSDEEIESDSEKFKTLQKARAKAEARYENDLEKAEQQQQEKLQERRERLDEANNFVTDWVTEDKFNATTSEDRIELRDHFETTPDDGEYNRAEKAVLLYADYGEDVAKNYLEGIRQQFVDTQREKVEETIDDSNPEPKSPPQPSSDDPNPEEEEEGFQSDNPMDTLRASFG